MGYFRWVPPGSTFHSDRLPPGVRTQCCGSGFSWPGTQRVPRRALVTRPAGLDSWFPTRLAGWGPCDPTLGEENAARVGHRGVFVLSRNPSGVKAQCWFWLALARDPEGTPPCPCYKAGGFGFVVSHPSRKRRGLGGAHGHFSGAEARLILSLLRGLKPPPPSVVGRPSA
jgi:hypothetical protein